MITATGAQYGCVFLEGTRENDFVSKSIAMNFDGAMVNPKDIHYSEKIIEETKSQRKIILIRNTPKEDQEKGNTDRMRSVLCVPLCHGDKYLGCVYLGNDMVTDLFSESAKKAAQILSAQADILLQNAYLMEDSKRLYRSLEKKVKEQTRDIEEKNKQLQEYNVKVMESERMKGLLGGTLAHDIKNYAAGIEGNATLLSKRFPKEDKVTRTVRIISESCLGIASLASNLVDIGKMEEGKLAIKMERITKQLLFATAEQFKQNIMFEEKNIGVTFLDTTNDTFEIEADYYLVERVLQNLFSNAAKYVPRNGTILLSLENNGEENIISCFNSGAPIPDKEKTVIFEKYARVDTASSQYSKGLGLFFCKMVMNAHVGRIWLDTDEKGNYFKLAFRKKVPQAIVSPAT
jgi:signal transduction histidine kinase